MKMIEYARVRNKFILFLFLFFPFNAESQLIINELMATNANNLIETDFYNFPDWVEIYNNGNESIDLSNYFLSDDENELQKWNFPSFLIDTNDYYLVYCDKKGTGKHTNFGLSASGESLYLSDASGVVIDHVDFDEQFSDISFGRNPADSNQWLYCATPTPGKINITTMAIEQSSRAEYSVPAGRLSSSTTLNLTGTNIVYTLDGSEPNHNSPVYSQSLNIDKTMIVKTKTYHDGYLPGKSYASTYFLNEHEFTLPVVSLSFTPDYFYDDTIGIHVRGVNGTEGNCGSMANWNQNWERAAYFEYFDENGIKQISQPVGVKLAGGCTRGRDQKSLSIYARSKYGNNDFDYAFFKQKPYILSYKSVLLRNSGNDQDQTLLRDAFLQALVNESMDIEYQSYQPTIVYFNGEYRGIMNIREKVDEDYFLSNYGIRSDEVDFLEGVLWSDFDNSYVAVRGSSSEYWEIINFISSNSLVNDDNYNWVVSQFDLQEYINYMTIQIYIANRDWPGNNLKFWKKSVDGKWRWILFDTDYGFGFRLDENGYKHETFDFATQTDGSSHPNPPWSTLLFRKLLENENFKKQFLSTFITHMYSSFTPEWCNYILDSLSNIIDYEISYNQAKYGRTKQQWQQYLNTLKIYAVNRHSFMPGYVKSFFNITADEVEITVLNPTVSMGKVKVNEALIQSYPFTMKTYQDLPITIEAVPEEGCEFKYWKSGDEKYSENPVISSNTSFNLSVRPVFTLFGQDDIDRNEITLDIIIFPNPSNGIINISIHDFEEFSANFYIEIIDINGKIVLPKIWLNNNHNTLNLKHLESGLYFARIFNNMKLISNNKILIIK